MAKSFTIINISAGPSGLNAAIVSVTISAIKRSRYVTALQIRKRLLNSGRYAVSSNP